MAAERYIRPEDCIVVTLCTGPVCLSFPALNSTFQVSQVTACKARKGCLCHHYIMVILEQGRGLMHRPGIKTLRTNDVICL